MYNAESPCALALSREGFTISPPFTQLEEMLTVQATLDVHWGKHHRAYVTNLNNQIKDKPLANKTLEEVDIKTLI